MKCNYKLYEPYGNLNKDIELVFGHIGTIHYDEEKGYTVSGINNSICDAVAEYIYPDPEKDYIDNANSKQENLMLYLLKYLKAHYKFRIPESVHIRLEYGSIIFIDFSNKTLLRRYVLEDFEDYNRKIYEQEPTTFTVKDLEKEDDIRNYIIMEEMINDSKE